MHTERNANASRHRSLARVQRGEDPGGDLDRDHPGPEAPSSPDRPLERLGVDMPDPADLDRLLGDVDLLVRLQLSAYAEEEWQPVATEFARYGLGVLPAWIGTRRVFGIVFQATGRTLPEPPEHAFDEDAVQDLATDTVLAALEAFLEKVLKRNRWDPAKGASLKTFFIGQCKFQFVTVYRRWLRMVEDEGRGQQRRVDPAEVDDWVTHPGPGADHDILAAEQWRETVALLTTDTARDVVALREMGYTHPEIAEILDLSGPRAVTNLLHHQRRKLGQTG